MTDCMVIIMQDLQEVKLILSCPKILFLKTVGFLCFAD